MVTDQLMWHTARASGIVAWTVLTTAVVWGLLLSTKLLGARPRPAWLLDVHRFLGAAAVVFTGVHVGALMLDGYVHFGPVEVLVPFASSWNPTAVAWGIAAMYLLLAVELTSLLRRRCSKRVWRAVHFLSFPLYVMATVHALTAGTDRTSVLMRYGTVASLLVVGFLAGLRLLAPRPARAARPVRTPRTPRPDRSPDLPEAPRHGHTRPHRLDAPPRPNPVPARQAGAAPSGSPYPSGDRDRERRRDADPHGIARGERGDLVRK